MEFFTPLYLGIRSKDLPDLDVKIEDAYMPMVIEYPLLEVD
jgi:hypothetical protein